MQIAALEARYVNISTGKRGSAQKMEKFILFRDVWNYTPNTGNADVDSDIKQLMSAFGSRLVINNNRGV